MGNKNSDRGFTAEAEKEGLLNEQAQHAQSDLESSVAQCFEPPEKHGKRQEISVVTKLALVSLILNLGLLVTCIFLARYIGTHMPHGQTCQDHAGIYSCADVESPASQAVEFVWHDPWQLDTKYSNAPGSDYAAVWSDLLEGTLLNVTKEEIQQSGERAFVEYETGGYAAGIGVGHDLHCLKRLKDFVWLEQLHPGLQRDESTKYQNLRDHADHCVDIIRQQVQCHPDILLYPLEYVEHSRISGKPTLSRLSQRKCVNFDKLHDWMKSRSGDANLFVKPSWL